MNWVVPSLNTLDLQAWLSTSFINQLKLTLYTLSEWGII